MKAYLKTLPLGEGVQILNTHPSGVIALEKPTGVLTHPNKKGDTSLSLLNANYDHREECFRWESGEQSEKAYLINRIDSPTSGIVLIASSAEAALELKKLFADRLVTKIYHAIVFGKLPKSRAHWKDSLDKKVSSNQIRVERSSRGVLAETQVSLISHSLNPYNISHLELKPITGRTHQLRIQCALNHLPIIGDKTYGNFDKNRKIAEIFGSKRLFLHAYSIEVPLRSKKEGKVVFSAQSPLPEIFNTLMNEA